MSRPRHDQSEQYAVPCSPSNRSRPPSSGHHSRRPCLYDPLTDRPLRPRPHSQNQVNSFDQSSSHPVVRPVVRPQQATRPRPLSQNQVNFFDQSPSHPVVRPQQATQPNSSSPPQQSHQPQLPNGASHKIVTKHMTGRSHHFWIILLWDDARHSYDEKDSADLYDRVTQDLGHDAVGLVMSSKRPQDRKFPEEVKEYLNRFGQNPENTLVFYYAGHGEVDPRSDRLILVA